MHRRTFLSAVGATALAGCSDGSDGATDPAAGVGSPSPAPAVTSSASPTPSDPSAARPKPPHKGVSFSPLSFESDDYHTFMEQAATAGTALRWAGPWTDLESQGAPSNIAGAAHDRGLAAVIDTGVYSVSASSLMTPLTTENREAFVENVAGFAAEHAPEYLGLGVEVNIHAEEDPDSFDTYVGLFAETQTAVAEVASETKVLVTFQYEFLRGLRGGLFGGENDPETARWDLLERFPAADVIGLTTYPGLIYRDPADIPADYFGPVLDRIDRPLAITETGWTVDTIAEGWESDEQEQAAFVRRLFDLVEPLDPELLIWLWVYAQTSDDGVFEGMTLRRDDGSARPAWDAWVEGTL